MLGSPLTRKGVAVSAFTIQVTEAKCSPKWAAIFLLRAGKPPRRVRGSSVAANARVSTIDTIS
jgi:hypothetical protein